MLAAAEGRKNVSGEGAVKRPGMRICDYPLKAHTFRQTFSSLFTFDNLFIR